MLAITIMHSCKKEEILKTDKAKVNHSEVLRVANSVVCENGVLVFSNWDAYYQIDSTLATYTFEEKKAWEDALNFKSQKQVFDNIATKEYAIFITLMKISQIRIFWKTLNLIIVPSIIPQLMTE